MQHILSTSILCGTSCLLPFCAAHLVYFHFVHYILSTSISCSTSCLLPFCAAHLVYFHFVQHILSTSILCSTSCLLPFCAAHLVFVSTEGDRFLIFFPPVLAKQTVNRRRSWIYFPKTGMPAWEQIRLLAALLCKRTMISLSTGEGTSWGNRWKGGGGNIWNQVNASVPTSPP